MTVSSPPVAPLPPRSPWTMPVKPVAPVPPVTPVMAVPENSEVASSTLQEDSISEDRRSKRRDKVLYVRVNTTEKEQIVAQAEECRLSISRYLTRLALEKRPPPTEEDKKRIETLLFFFKRTEMNVRRLHAEASRMRLFSVVPGIEEDFDATLETVRGLMRELGKRL